MADVKIVQLDGTLPNLALARLSAWHKAQGDVVHFSRSPYRQLGEPSFAAVYGSAIFAFSRKRVDRLRLEYPDAIVGGTGSGSTATVEQVVPTQFTATDFSLWPDFSASLGFTQRGCRLACKFCVVPAKEGKPRHESTVWDLWRGDPWPRNLHLLDNDFFGGPNWVDRVGEIRDGGFRVCFSQGINVRAVTDEVAEALAGLEYRDSKFQRRRLYAAWDNLKDEDVFFRGVDTLERHGIPASDVMAYMLVGFDKRETWDRILYRFGRMVDRGIRPYPMVFDPARRDLKQFQRWAVRGLYRAIPWDQYDPGARAQDPAADLQGSFAL